MPMISKYQGQGFRFELTNRSVINQAEIEKHYAYHTSIVSARASASCPFNLIDLSYIKQLFTFPLYHECQKRIVIDICVVFLNQNQKHRLDLIIIL